MFFVDFGGKLKKVLCEFTGKRLSLKITCFCRFTLMGNSHEGRAGSSS